MMKDVSVPLTLREIMAERYNEPFETDEDWQAYVDANGDLWMLVNPMDSVNRDRGFGDVVFNEHRALYTLAVKKAGRA